MVSCCSLLSFATPERGRRQGTDKGTDQGRGAEGGGRSWRLAKATSSREGSDFEAGEGALTTSGKRPKGAGSPGRAVVSTGMGAAGEGEGKQTGKGKNSCDFRGSVHEHEQAEETETRDCEAKCLGTSCRGGGYYVVGGATIP